MALRIAEQAGLTDVGRQRNTNEDAYYADAPVFAVADGMGGARAGEVASQMAVEEFGGDAPGESEEAQLARIAEQANRRIWEHAQADESRAGMGTTLTAAIVGDNEVTIGHVGDSRAYRLRDHRLEQLTHDHSLVAELERRGELRHEDAESHPQKNIITRALGPEPDVEVDTHTHPAQAGDVYLLCSDGLTTMVAEDRVADILRGAGTLHEAAQQLVDEANRRGGKDNTTVVLFRLEQGEPTAADASATGDTLAGDDADEVRAAVAAQAAEAEPPHEEPPRSRPARIKPAPPRARPKPEAGEPRRSRLRRLAPAIVALLVAALVAGGLYLGARQVYFLGTNDQGLVTAYRGLPYDLPLGVELYSEEIESSVPARSIPPGRRARLLDHEFRSRNDAADLLRQLERERLGR